MLANYLPILVFMAIGILFGIGPLILGRILGPFKPNKEKSSAYECGFSPFEDARLPFDVKFYLVAILFIIFDLETAFLFPWAISLHHLGWVGFWAMMVF